jgi:hypothetical protein
LNNHTHKVQKKKKKKKRKELNYFTFTFILLLLIVGYNYLILNKILYKKVFIFLLFLTIYNILIFHIGKDKLNTLNDENFYLKAFKEFHQLRLICLANHSLIVINSYIKIFN